MVPKCRECKEYIYNPLGRNGRSSHCCLLVRLIAGKQGKYHNGLMYANEAKTSPKWCPKRGGGQLDNEQDKHSAMG